MRADGFTIAAWSAALDRQSPRGPGTAPVLIVHGEDDEAVDVEWTRRLATAGEIELRTYAGADHMGIASAAGADVIAHILDALRVGQM